MPIKIGTAGIPLCCKGNTSEGIRTVKELGLQALEVEFVRGVKMRNDTAQDIGEVAKKLDVSLSVHAPYYINLASKQKKKIEDSKERILDSCERAHNMGADIVVFHPAYLQKRESKIVQEIVVKVCGEMRDFIKEKKWKILLGLETTGKLGAFGNLEENIEVCKAVNGCRVVIDFAHLYARNQGKIDYDEILKKVLKIQSHLHCHFSGINFTKQGEKNHEEIGKPDFKPLAKLLVKRKIDVTIICESPLIERDALKMKKNNRRVWI